MHQNKHLYIAVLIVAIVILFSLGRGGLWGAVDENTYQAVFLTSNQTYFGKLSNLSGGYLKLSDIYYLKENPQGQGQSPLSLIKFGDEVQQPQDEIFISSKQVLLWENLREDSKVVQLIQQQKAQAAAPAN